VKRHLQSASVFGEKDQAVNVARLKDSIRQPTFYPEEPLKTPRQKVLGLGGIKRLVSMLADLAFPNRNPLAADLGVSDLNVADLVALLHRPIVPIHPETK
jgi:hypothetical protein